MVKHVTTQDPLNPLHNTDNLEEVHLRPPTMPSILLPPQLPTPVISSDLFIAMSLKKTTGDAEKHLNLSESARKVRRNKPKKQHYTHPPGCLKH